MANLTATKEVTETKKLELREHGFKLIEGQTVKDIASDVIAGKASDIIHLSSLSVVLFVKALSL